MPKVCQHTLDTWQITWIDKIYQNYYLFKHFLTSLWAVCHCLYHPWCLFSNTTEGKIAEFSPLLFLSSTITENKFHGRQKQKVTKFCNPRYSFLITFVDNCNFVIKQWYLMIQQAFEILRHEVSDYSQTKDVDWMHLMCNSPYYS